MLTELRTKSQITIPKDIVMKMGLREGDKLEIVEKDGVIELMPVAVYPKKYLDELRSEINEVFLMFTTLLLLFKTRQGSSRCSTRWTHCLKRWTVRTNELQDHLHQTVHKEPEAFERSGAGAAEKEAGNSGNGPAVSVAAHKAYSRHGRLVRVQRKHGRAGHLAVRR